MSEEDGLLWAFRVDSNGRGQSIGWDELDEVHEDEFRWIHLDLKASGTRQWVREKSGLRDVEIETLLAEETRPRATPMSNGVVVNLRGVNLNPGSDPEDMVSVRIWIESNRVITLRRRRLLALQDVRDQMAQGSGAKSVGEFVADVASRLVDRMAGVLGDLDESLDSVEEESMESTTDKRMKLLELRRQAIALRRYLSPQRDALARLSTERVPWLDEHDRFQLREVLDRTTRYVEDLEAARERAAVTQEEFASRLAEELNKRMYALGIVAGIFLPISFVTGLLGINVAGMPGASTDWAFAAVCVMLALLVVGEIILFRRLRWL